MIYNKQKYIEYVHKYEHLVNKCEFRLNSHLQPRIGWQNDPNGFIKFKDTYFYAYQYNPYKIPKREGKLHWGLYTTKDFVNFIDHGPILYPDQSFDKDGVYSGSSIIVNKQIYTYYTGNVKYDGNFDYINKGREHNTCLAISSDGINYESKRLILTNFDYPSNLTKHVRDPFVFKQFEKYYMLLGARTKDNYGQILIFESLDAINFKFKNVFYEDETKKLGYMFECPNIVTISNKTFLIFSPQGVKKDKFANKFANKFNSLWVEGQINWNKGIFIPSSKVHEFDLGPDFYAPQILNSEKIMLSWSACLEEYDYNNHITKNKMWDQCQNYPRKLFLKNDKIYQKPLVNLSLLKDETQTFLANIKNSYLNFKVTGKQTWKLFNESFIIEYDNTTLNFVYKNLEIGGNRKNREYTNIILTNLEIYIDNSLIEIYINKGEYVYSSRIFPYEFNLKLLKKQNYQIGLINNINVTTK